ncbi:hypothetical protein PR048_022495 [Dryococelus australis]|uniref:Neurotransmitter-gated ion-channel ligand-binding domain-containing protein n=1 Tax=Dryococelus australis TaxID=614101 RepID=A0ABQ9H196_9NEOP|nr:hypothetical protein PR048_022495 [Dryococelus australis]
MQPAISQSSVPASLACVFFSGITRCDCCVAYVPSLGVAAPAEPSRTLRAQLDPASNCQYASILSRFEQIRSLNISTSQRLSETSRPSNVFVVNARDADFTSDFVFSRVTHIVLIICQDHQQAERCTGLNRWSDAGIRCRHCGGDCRKRSLSRLSEQSCAAHFSDVSPQGTVRAISVSQVAAGYVVAQEGGGVPRHSPHLCSCAQDFTLDFYFRQFWTDPRLAFRKRPGVETLSVGSEFIKNIWVPDTFFVNEKQSYFHIATTSNEFIRIHHSGSITRSIR